MYENAFHETVDQISEDTGVCWNTDSQLRILARFLGQRHPELYDEFEAFVKKQADEENEQE